jgi:hypothetical protein
MKIRLLVSRSGPAGAQNAGDQIDVPDAEAMRMIEAGQATPIRTAAKGKPERAVKDA